MEKVNNNFKCEKCNKIYTNASGIWKHNAKYHSNEMSSESIHIIGNGIPTSIHDKSTSNLLCKFCNKKYSNRQSRWRHEKNCNVKNKDSIDKKNLEIQNQLYKETIEDLINEHKIMINRIEKLEKKNKPIIVNNTNNILNNNCNNKTLNICQPGSEDVKLLSNIDKKFIMSQGMNSIISIVDKLNFNEELPQNHNFYVSAINDKHVNTIDTKTNNIIKQSKKDLFDKILFNHMNKLESISKNNSKFMDVFDKLKNFIYLKKGKKEFVNQLNMLSYNKRNIVIKTWNDLLDDNISADEATQKFESKVNELISLDKNINKKPKEVIQLIETDSDSD